MTLKLYTLRGKHSGSLYYATGHTMVQAAREIKISPRHLILERSEVLPAQTQMLFEPSNISSHTVRYIEPTV